MKVKHFIFSTILLFNIPLTFSQVGVDNVEFQKSDFAIRAQNQIRVFLENIPVIAAGNKSEYVINACIENTLKIFSTKAFIEEQNKYTKNRKKRSPREYLYALKKRQEKSPIIINFEVIDDISPDKLKRKVNADGSISYTGKMFFKQYYCVLDKDFYKEKNLRPDDSCDCAYEDVTDKKVTFEIILTEDQNGQFWVTKITSIEVMRTV